MKLLLNSLQLLAMSISATYALNEPKHLRGLKSDASEVEDFDKYGESMLCFQQVERSCVLFVAYLEDYHLSMRKGVTCINKLFFPSSSLFLSLHS